MTYCHHYKICLWGTTFFPSNVSLPKVDDTHFERSESVPSHPPIVHHPVDIITIVGPRLRRLQCPLYSHLVLTEIMSLKMEGRPTPDDRSHSSGSAQDPEKGAHHLRAENAGVPDGGRRAWSVLFGM